jgi:hypothetical protein
MISYSVKIFLFSLVYISIISFDVTAQSTVSDSVFYQNAIANTVAKYHLSTDHQARIYNGNQYNSYPFKFKNSHPFFKNDSFMKGSIVYDNVLYPNVLLLYNEHFGSVILKDGSNAIQLVKQRVDKFTITNNEFVRIIKDSLSQALIQKDGFYNVIYQGKSIVFKQEIKTIEEDISNASEGIVRSLSKIDYYFIKKEGVFYNIHNKKSLLAVFAENKKEINAFIKNEKLSFKFDREAMIIKVVDFYDKNLKK